MILNISILKGLIALFSFIPLVSCASSPIRAQEKAKLSKVHFDLVEGDLGSAQLEIAALVDNENFNFQLDTGANQTFLANSPSLTHYPVMGKSRTTSAAGITVTEDKVRLLSFRIGDFVKKEFEVVRYKMGTPFKNRLGMNALPDKLQFDFKNKKLSFHLYAHEVLKKNKLILYGDSTFGMEIHFGADTVEAVWDTGAELSVIDQDLIEKNPAQFRHQQTITNGVDATGNAVKLELYSFDGLHVGDKILRGTIMSMNFKPIQEKMGEKVKIILGTNLIRNNNWYFDRTERTWSID